MVYHINMIRLAHNTCDWIREHLPKDKINKLSIVVILLYYYIGLLSYITVPIRPIYNLFISSSSFSIVVRACLTALVCFYSLLVIIVNREKMQWKWLIIFVYVLLFTLLSTALSPQNYTYIYVTKLYNIVHKAEIAPGLSRILILYLSSISDFALAFCFLFILPLVINDKKQLFILLIPVIVIAVFECIYSLVFEKEEYIKLIKTFNDGYGGYQINIGATFGNKQDWGAFISTAFGACFFVFLCIKEKKASNIFFKIVLLFLSFVFLVFTAASLCKTAIISELIIFSFFVVFLLIKAKRDNKILFIVLTTIFMLLILLFILFLSLEQLRTNHYLELLYNLLNKYFFEKVSINTIWGRTSIWYKTIENLRTYNLFFGLSKAGVNAFSKTVIIEGQNTLHNGFAYFMLSYGIFGFVVYLLLFATVIRRVSKIYKIDFGLSLCLFGFMGCAIIFSLAESEVLIVSGSNPIFIFNILLCSFSKGYYDRKVCLNA